MQNMSLEAGAVHLAHFSGIPSVIRKSQNHKGTSQGRDSRFRENGGSDHEGTGVALSYGEEIQGDDELETQPACT